MHETGISKVVPNWVTSLLQLFFFFFGSGRPRGPKVIRKLGRKTGRQAGKQAKWAGRPVMHKPNSQDQGRQNNEP